MKEQEEIFEITELQRKIQTKKFNKTQVIDKEINITLYNHKLYLKYIGITDE